MEQHRNLERLEYLFPRYWDSALTEAEQAELEHLLASDVEARHSFLLLSMQTVAPAELSALATRLPGTSSTIVPAPSRSWTRRKLLQYGAGGLAVGLAGLALGAFRAGWWRSSSQAQVTLTSVRGIVWLNDQEDRPIQVGMSLPGGAELRTVGHHSSAMLSYADGTTVSITGDTSLTIETQRKQLTLREGTATANVLPVSKKEEQLILATPAARLTSTQGAAVTLGSDDRATEVGVQIGRVSVSDRAGVLLGDVREGEILTVRAGGNSKKQPLPPTPTSFQMDFREPLPEGWAVGYRQETPEGPVVCPEFWYDPYHSAVLSQIRSNNQWTRGFVRLYPDSRIRVRYWIDRPGRGQLCICVRTPHPNVPASGVVEVNDAFVHSRPQAWQWLECQPRDMLDHREAPTFGPPWIGFLIIFNTYEVDLGLRVADLRVSRNGDSAQG